MHETWNALLESYRNKHPELADQLERMGRRELHEGWDADLPVFPADAKGIASRDSSGKVLNAIAKNHPWLMGGSADTLISAFVVNPHGLPSSSTVVTIATPVGKAVMILQ